MPQKTPTAVDLFAAPNETQQEIIEFIDDALERGVGGDEIEDTIADKYRVEEVAGFAMLYLRWQYSQIDIGGTITNGPGDEQKPQERDGDGGEEFQNHDNCSYEIFCEADNEDKKHDVMDETDCIRMRFRQFLHIDIILHEEGLGIEQGHIDIEDSLRVDAATLRGKGSFSYEFDSMEIAQIRADGLLHVPAFMPDVLLGDDYVMKNDEEDTLVLSVFRKGKFVASKHIKILGPWPLELTASDAQTVISRGASPRDFLTVIRSFAGWGNFKKRMEEATVCRRIEKEREKAGLSPNGIVLHSLIIGHSGTGKTTAACMMAALWRSLGLLDGPKILSTNVSKLSASNLNGEYENTVSTVENAQGGAVVFEDAHELYHTEVKNYDAEERIVRALTDALDNPKFKKWMLVLTGEQEGIEALMAANPSLAKHFTKPIYMEDFTTEELCSIAESICSSRGFVLPEESLRKLKSAISHGHIHQKSGTRNVRFVEKMFDEQIVPAMYRRLGNIPEKDAPVLQTIMPEDIPSVSADMGEAAIAELDSLIGLEKIKTRVKDFLYAVRLAGRRMEMGLPATMPRLNMVFLGNPGTGKTTVAEIIGRVFSSWGILSEGRVIRTEKSQMVGQYIGETEFKMNNLLARANGNILFIDEAYQLVEGGERDYGRIVMNSLLTELGKDNPNFVVILAGYTAPMKKLIESNAGIGSRFPNVISFEDYTADELMEIGKNMIQRQGFTLTEGAAAKMRAIIEEESEKPSPRFGNGRFVSNLLRNEILAALGTRTASLANPTAEQLSTILPEDVVIDKAHRDIVFDNEAIDAALMRLDAIVGMENVKTAIHNFVHSARYLHSIGEPYVGKGLLSWRFIGHSGTGKSTIAEIMAAILRGMRLISNSNITEIKGERIFNASEADCDSVLAEAVKRSCNGLIFIDIDNPQFNGTNPVYGRGIEQVRLKIQELTVESGGECALVLAELDAPNKSMAEQLSDAGIHEFDHTLIFKDFTPDELYGILCSCLSRHGVTFSPATEKHMRGYLNSLPSSAKASARTMKLMSRTIYQQVILRESGLARPPKTHQVQLQDVATFRWNPKKGRIGF